jgi:hypothetical protein
VELVRLAQQRDLERHGAGQVLAGHVDRGENALLHITALIADFMRAGSADLGEALRPVYIDYLTRHPQDPHQS